LTHNVIPHHQPGSSLFTKLTTVWHPMPLFYIS